MPLFPLGPLFPCLLLSPCLLSTSSRGGDAQEFVDEAEAGGGGEGQNQADHGHDNPQDGLPARLFSRPSPTTRKMTASIARMMRSAAPSLRSIGPPNIVVVLLFYSRRRHLSRGDVPGTFRSAWHVPLPDGRNQPGSHPNVLQFENNSGNPTSSPHPLANRC